MFCCLVSYAFSIKTCLMGCRESDLYHQFCYLMFNLLIVQLFEKCVFVLRTEWMVWENGPIKISYIMSTIEKTAIQDFYLLCYYFSWSASSYWFHVIVSSDMAEWPLSLMKLERTVGESNHKTITGWISDMIRFLRGLLNKPRSSIWFTNKCKNFLWMGCALCFWLKKNRFIKVIC